MLQALSIRLLFARYCLKITTIADPFKVFVSLVFSFPLLLNYEEMAIFFKHLTIKKLRENISEQRIKKIMFKKTTAFRRLAKVITKSKCELIIIVSMLSETIVNHKGIKVVRMFFRTKSFKRMESVCELDYVL